MVADPISSGNSLGMYITTAISLMPDHFTTSHTGTVLTQLQTSCLCLFGISINIVQFDNSAVLITAVGLDTEALLNWTCF